MPLDPSSQASIRAAYDLACEEYARRFVDELAHKPLDRELLARFAALVGPERPVLDLGCGPGHTTAHLTSLGLAATGVDLSPNMVAKAQLLFPQPRFVAGDFFALPNESSSVGGILAFYCIVHLTPEQLVPAFSEMLRVLCGGGVLLLAFHAGSDIIRADNFLETGAALDFAFFEPEHVRAALETAGFEVLDVRLREPYAIEHPSRRCYVFARKAQGAA
jgi:SAM-dependent methyltransferase